jgi:CRISPR system Cascade subunit CasD
VAERLTTTLPLTVLTKAPFSPVIPALLHDLGKVSPGFQLHISRDYVNGVLPELAAFSTNQFCTDHACIGAAAVQRVLDDRPRLSALSQIVAMHHGGIRQEAYPTRSGVIGLVAAAMGIDRDDEQALADLAPDRLAMTVLVLQQEGRLIDFHTVGGGWDTDTHPLNVARKASDKPGRNTGNTVVTHREYLTGCRFGAVLSGAPKLAARVATAVADPKWGVWLGRKACIPASPVLQGVFDSEDEAVACLCERAHCAQPACIVREVGTFAEGTDTHLDTPRSFAANRQDRFSPRRVAVSVPEG